MSLKPWREIAVPHADVLEGTFLQSEFAADITAVHTGKGHPRRLLELSERNPEAILTWLKLVRELIEENVAEQVFPPEIFERTLHPRHLLEPPASILKAPAFLAT